MVRWLLAYLCLLFTSSLASAEVTTRPMEYRVGDATFEGQLTVDGGPSGKRPSILLAHEVGASGFAARQRASQFARLGYIVLTADLYGKGVVPKDRKGAIAKAGVTAKDRKPLRARIESALNTLYRQSQVDPKRVAAVGYGLGGTAVLELARGGADLEGVVCVHGDLSTLNPDEAKQISASLLVILGTDDPYIPLAQLGAFEEEMRHGGVDWQVLRLGGAVHDFTNPQAGRNLKSGSAYDADADKRAHEAMRSFLNEVLPASSPPTAKPAAKTDAPAVKGVPEKVLKVLKHVDEENEAPENHEGGRTFLNLEKLLPQADAQGRRIKYREWDVNPLRPGVNRGAERLVTGSDGSAHYTDDHYKSFKKLR